MSIHRKRQSLVGEVISTKMEKTVTVRVLREIPHPVYQKRVKRYKNYLAHVASVVPNDGDIVKISSTKPISKLKRWQVSQIVRKAERLG
ncbi:MAG: 30S ribosomal protein S17 [Candidatus Neomarinimicrobiota bacterium]|nr:MAG: 30S ribosomal protein S17 [Candidatus Neomarinimicrobiota bacterium]